MTAPGPGSDPAFDEERPPRDPMRALRKTVSQIVVVFTIPFVFSIVQAALGGGRLKVDRSPAAWTVWTAGVALMVVASLLAVQSLRGKAPAWTGRSAAWWCAAIWGAGLILTVVYSNMVPPPTR
ncbi:hypothetical protein [Dactylosporangium sp. CA-139066]|uniref:hypothetical protein n=1 Tax=Dactylosporangium sp. CA-139066 TaxID=3239930 RepID=UPI003D8C7A2F